MTTPANRFQISGTRVSAAAIAATGVLFGSTLFAQERTYKPGSKSKPADQTPSRNEAPSKDKVREEGKELFGPGKAGGKSHAEANHWSIVIEAFREEDQEVQARDGLAKVRSLGGLPGAYLERRGAATVIAYGRYADAGSKEAKEDLAKVRAVEVVMDGKKQKPFATAFLAPPEAVPGTIPEYDLANARRLNGDWALYTLQVGVYSNEDPRRPVLPAEMAEFRKTAELAVVQLRREGEQAFYYHGPNRSSVTIGLFGVEDFDPQNPKMMSPALTSLRKRFPYNLQNGMGIRMRTTVTDPATGKKIRQEKIQPSGLMNVPEDQSARGR